MISFIPAFLLGKRNLDSDKEQTQDPQSRLTNGRTLRIGSRLGQLLVTLPVIRDRVPIRYRPALFFETLYNAGAGAFIALMLLSTVVLKTVLDGSAAHLALLGAIVGGSSLLSPLVSYCGRRISMRSLVWIPNLIVAGILLCTAAPFGGATFFTLVVGLAFVIRAFPRVAEMNMFRVNYPPTHRGAAVGWVKAVASTSALAVTLFGWWWFSFYPGRYWLLYCLVAAMLAGAALCYARIPVARRNVFARDDGVAPHHAFRNGTKAFLSDRRFVLYQLGFAFGGFANHLCMVYIAQVLVDDVLAGMTTSALVPWPLHDYVLSTWQLDRATLITIIVGFVIAVLPMLVMTTSSPLWGRLLDRINPMLGRSIFNSIQVLAFACYAYGGMITQVWPFLVGAFIHAVGNGGGTINWLTGSMYLAATENISLYNSVHVGLTGIRALIAPLVGWYLLSPHGFGMGSGIFWISAVLSLIGAAMMLWQGLTDPGPRE